MRGKYEGKIMKDEVKKRARLTLLQLMMFSSRENPLRASRPCRHRFPRTPFSFSLDLC
jgi:hypothetical protein